MVVNLCVLHPDGFWNSVEKNDLLKSNILKISGKDSTFKEALIQIISICKVFFVMLLVSIYFHWNSD